MIPVAHLILGPIIPSTDYPGPRNERTAGTRLCDSTEEYGKLTAASVMLQALNKKWSLFLPSLVTFLLSIFVAYITDGEGELKYE